MKDAKSEDEDESEDNKDSSDDEKQDCYNLSMETFIKQTVQLA